MGDWSWSDQRQQWVYDPAAPSPGQNPAVTQILPMVAPTPSPRPRGDDFTGNDHLVVRTDNGLRPDDLTFPQPPQDPDWRPDANR